MHYFKVSPVDPTFMMTGNDMTAAYYSTDGQEFQPVDMPLHRWANNVTFSPHDGEVAYMHYGHSCDSVGACYPAQKAIPGIWRTKDKGETWEQIYTMPPDAPECRGPAGKQQIVIDPHTDRKDHIYLGSYHLGLVRSVDDGKTWQSVAFKGSPVKTIEAAKGPDNRTILYVIVSSPEQVGSRNYVYSGHLWRVEVDPKAPFALKKHLLSKEPEFIDVEVSPHDWSSGLAIIKRAERGRGGQEIVVFKDAGNQVKTVRNSSAANVLGFVDIHINPNNTDHVLVRSLSRYLSTAIQYSMDGGYTWNERYKVVDGHVLSMISLNPAHFSAPGGAMRDMWHHGQGPAVGFDARDPSVVYWWAQNFDKTPLKSTDYGATWKPFAYGGFFKKTNQIAIGPESLYMAVAKGEYGFSVSKDSGLSWRGQTHRINPLLAEEAERGQHMTEEQFEQLSPAMQIQGPQHKYGWGLGMKPDDPEALVGIYGRFPSLFISRDGGDSWQDTEVNARGVGNVYWSPANTSYVYAADRRSHDAGSTWVQMDRFVLAISPINEQVLVGNPTLGDPQLSLSMDAGRSWKDMPPIPEEQFPETDISKSPFSPSLISRIQVTHAVAIDPTPEHDPLKPENAGVRILAAGRSGVYEYTAPTGYPCAGSWKVINEGFEPSVHFSRVKPVPWIGHVAFDPRPGMEHVVYACKSADPRMRREWRTLKNPNMLNFNGQARRPLYRSLDGGKTWSNLHAPEYYGIPDHLDVTALEIGPDGTLYVDRYCGIYALPGVPGE
jgi:hypothetical protein